MQNITADKYTEDSFEISSKFVINLKMSYSSMLSIILTIKERLNLCRANCELKNLG